MQLALMNKLLKDSLGSAVEYAEHLKEGEQGKVRKSELPLLDLSATQNETKARPAVICRVAYGYSCSGHEENP